MNFSACFRRATTHYTPAQVDTQVVFQVQPCIVAICMIWTLGEILSAISFPPLNRSLPCYYL